MPFFQGNANMKRENFLLPGSFIARSFSFPKAVWPHLEGIIFPSRCIICKGLLVDGEQGVFCIDCFYKFQPLPVPLCRVCGIPLAAAGVCEQCLRTPPPYSCCRSLFTYNEIMRKLVLQFKSRRDRLFLAGIQQLCSRMDLSEFTGVDIVAPVPLHPQRLKKRGFNQSLLLCELLFSGKKDVKIIPKLLKRKKNTVSQSSLPRKKRLENLKKMFSFCGDDTLSGMHICLVDDVITTGATVEECCKIIEKSIDCKISVLSLAKTLRKRDSEKMGR